MRDSMAQIAHKPTDRPRERTRVHAPPEKSEEAAAPPAPRSARTTSSTPSPLVVLNGEKSRRACASSARAQIPSFYSDDEILR